jgi:hypothetical protein
MVSTSLFCFRQWVLLFDYEGSLEGFRVFDALLLLIVDPWLLLVARA